MGLQGIKDHYEDGLMKKDFIESAVYGAVFGGIYFGARSMIDIDDPDKIADSLWIAAMYSAYNLSNNLREYSSDGMFGQIRSFRDVFTKAAKNYGQVAAAFCVAIPAYILGNAINTTELISKNSSGDIVVALALTAGVGAIVKTALDALDAVEQGRAYDYCKRKHTSSTLKPQ